jgi:hypothetical protein
LREWESRQLRPRSGALFGGSGDESVGKRLEQKKALTLAQSQESVFSERKASTLWDAVLRLWTAPARSIRLILTFPSAPAPVETLAERSENTRPARSPFEIAFVLMLAFLSPVPLARIGLRHTSRNYKARANM